MDSKKLDKEEKKSVQPPQKDMASGQKRETTFHMEQRKMN